MTFRTRLPAVLLFLMAANACHEEESAGEAVAHAAIEEREVPGCYALEWQDLPPSDDDMPTSVRLLEAHPRVPTRGGPGGSLELPDTLDSIYPARVWERFGDSLHVYLGNGFWGLEVQVAYTSDSVLYGFGRWVRDFSPSYDDPMRVTARRRACVSVLQPAI